MNKNELAKIMMGLYITAMGILCADTYFDKKAQEFRSLHNTGITHQYVDTDGDGKFDLYRFVQKRREILGVDYNGDGTIDKIINEKKNRIYSVNLEQELSKEECMREYRPGTIEFTQL